MDTQQTPYICHVFVCSNVRDHIRRSCGDDPVVNDIKGMLKDAVKDRGLKSSVRVTSSGCLGACDEGPNVMIYPQQIWYSFVTKEDVPDILDRVFSIVEKEAEA